MPTKKRDVMDEIKDLDDGMLTHMWSLLVDTGPDDTPLKDEMRRVAKERHIDLSKVPKFQFDMSRVMDFTGTVPGVKQGKLKVMT